mgnify:CR=1 FL=1
MQTCKILLCTGITPARAGKRDRRRSRRSPPRDHPRTRGEKYLESVALQLHTGSPPHARGKVLLSLLYESGNRITPARAGKRKGWLLKEQER